MDLGEFQNKVERLRADSENALKAAGKGTRSFRAFADAKDAVANLANELQSICELVDRADSIDELAEHAQLFEKFASHSKTLLDLAAEQDSLAQASDHLSSIASQSSQLAAVANDVKSSARDASGIRFVANPQVMDALRAAAPSMSADALSKMVASISADARDALFASENVKQQLRTRELLDAYKSATECIAPESVLKLLKAHMAFKREAFKPLVDFASNLDAAKTIRKLLDAVKTDIIGARSGRLKELQKFLSEVPPDGKPIAGKYFTELKRSLETDFASGIASLAAPETKNSQVSDFDPTLPGTPLGIGHLHPITQTIDELKDIMGRLGFTVAAGPEIEDEWHNFDALNIPAAHPARDPLENFYLSTGRVGAGLPAGAPLLLRSQTSTVQIRVMEKSPPPVRIISLGRVYRPDTADATHYPMFHQIEGLLVDRQVTMADLKSVLRLFASSYLGSDVHIRFRPSFFPFTEPSVEVDMSWHDDGGRIRWVEMGGAGMVDPNVLRAVGYDPEEVTGFAFGLGVERVCARRHGVSDIREFYKNDVRFLSQF